jgi:hypothetical protein
MAKFNDITGQRFGKLTVLRRGSTKNTKIHWLCQCDCGKTKEISGYHLTRKATISTKSCGCLWLASISLSGDEGSFNGLYHNYMLGAKSRKHEFCLSKEQFRAIASDFCFYCGAAPKPFYSIQRKTEAEPFITNGIDRVDNTIGYVKENCVPCCGVCNFMKRDMSASEFRTHIRKIAIHVGEADV